jgi:hypothetical protein
MHNSDALHQKSGKTNFEVIYDLEDPREYFNTLGNFGYCIPQHGQRVFSELIEARRAGVNGNGTGEGRTKVVDVCCSYGVIAALLKHDIVIDDLYTRYRSEELAGLSSEELARADAAFYGERMKEGAPEVVGVDVARHAVSYGLRSGVLDAGFAENLEEDEPTEELRRAVSGTDLLTITGGVGYISESTFERLLGCMAGEDGRLPWIAVFALRWVSYDDISDVLSSFGLVTEKLAGNTFTQRRFTGAEEREYVLEELAGMDVDSTGREDTGWYHANFYLSRPVQDASIPLETLLDL